MHCVHCALDFCIAYKPVMMPPKIDHHHTHHSHPPPSPLNSKLVFGQHHFPISTQQLCLQHAQSWSSPRLIHFLPRTTSPIFLTPTPVTKSMPRSTSSSIRCHFCLHHRRAFNIIFGRQCRTCYHRPCPKCATIGGESTDEVPPQPRPEELAIARKSQQNSRKSH